MTTSSRYDDQQPIRSYEEFERSLRNFDWLQGRVPGLTDIDGFLEKKGDILILEGKTRQGTKVVVPIGQFIGLLAFAKKPGIDVWLVAEGKGAKDGAPGAYSVCDITNLSRPDFESRENGRRVWGFFCKGPHAKKRGWMQTDVNGLADMVGDWWDERQR